ncbi:MAG: isoprenyl transferase [Ignavibacteria bacterium]
MKKKLSDNAKRYVDSIKDKINIPRHVAIIMDGNGRWAAKRGLPRVVGHKNGVETVREIVELCAQLGIEYLTLYTFSTENWKRPREEVSTLMRLIVKSLQSETNELHSNNVRLTTIGDMSQLPEVVQNELQEAIKKTRNNKRMTLNLALSYSGRTELTNAVQNICRDIEKGKISKSDICEKLISNYLYTSNIPDPDLMIRSGGEFRISNFLLWQIAYSEIFITDVLWPDFGYKEFLKAIEDYQKRERRFGLISEQINNEQEKNKNVEKLPKQMVEL